MPPLLLLAAAIAGVLLVLGGLGGCERRPTGASADHSEGPPVAKVNGQMIYQREFSTVLPQDWERVLTVEERKEYLDRWIQTELLYDKAVKSGLGVTPEIQARLEQYKRDLVADQLVQKVIKEKAVVSDAEARAYYQAHRNEYTREYRVSHILMNTLEDAEKAKEALKTKPFSWVERRYTIDRHTGPGGDLGFLSKGDMIPEFEKVVFKMKVGQVSDIIESEFGYHIIKLTDVRESRDKLEYEDVADDIARTLLLRKRAAVYDSLVTALFDTADIEILDPEMRLVASSPPDSGALGVELDSVAVDSTYDEREPGQ